MTRPELIEAAEEHYRHLMPEYDPAVSAEWEKRRRELAVGPKTEQQKKKNEPK